MALDHPRQLAPWLIAHRGARDEAPENTASAFKRALAYPIDGIELDVQLSADGVAVVFHDRTLMRVNGRRKRVAEMTSSQLSAMDWGAWFSNRYKGEPLLTLDRTLALWGGRTRLMIELKIHPGDFQSGHAGRLTRTVMDLLDRHAARIPTDRIFILSFNAKALRIAHGLAPQWRYVLNLSEKEPNAITALSKEATRYLWAVGVKISRLSALLTVWARDRGLGVLTYPCNGARQLKKALGLEVNAILSDRPGWLTRCLHDRLRS